MCTVVIAIMITDDLSTISHILCFKYDYIVNDSSIRINLISQQAMRRCALCDAMSTIHGGSTWDVRDTDGVITGRSRGAHGATIWGYSVYSATNLTTFRSKH